MGRTTHLDLEVTVALQGTLDTFALSDVLRLLAATKKTGCLRITGGRGTGSIWVDGGGVSGIEAPHVPDATGSVDALFELLRFEEGSFTFDADATHDAPGSAEDIELLLAGAEETLREWRQIEAVVPSLDAWVTLRRILDTPEVSIEQAHWTTLVTVGSGATVRQMSEELDLAELPVSRAVRDLVERGLVDIEASEPSGRAESAMPPGEPQVVEPPSQEPAATTDEHVADEHPADDDEPTVDSSAGLPIAPERSAPASAAVADEATVDAPLPVARPLRARRARHELSSEDPAPAHRFVPLDLPGQGPAVTYDPIEAIDDGDPDEAEFGLDDLAAAFPGLANRVADPTHDDEELARQLATLSPRAADAVRAAAEASTDEERDAALDEAEADAEEPINRGLLLKFLSSVKS